MALDPSKIIRVRTVVTGIPGAPGLMTINGAFDSVDVGNSLRSKIVAALNTIRDVTHNGVTFTVLAQMDVLTVADGTIFSSNTAAGGDTMVVGTAAGNMAPPASQVNVRMTTSTIRNGRRVLGHIYVPGITVQNIDQNGAVASATIGEYQAAFAGLLTATFPPVVFSQPVVPVGEGPARPGAASIVTGVAAQTKLAVLRSRRDLRDEVLRRCDPVGEDAGGAWATVPGRAVPHGCQACVRPSCRIWGRGHRPHSLPPHLHC